MKRPRAPPSPSFSSPSSGPPVGGPDDIALGDQLDKRKKTAASGANKKPGGIDENSETGRGNGRRSSNYRGVTRHRSSGKFEAHFWDNTYRSAVKARKGQQLYLGAYDTEEAAARAYDLAALKYWGLDAPLHFPVDDYENEMEEMQKVNMKEYVAILRRRSNGFSRGSSRYRGVTRHQLSGRWEARIRKDTAGKYLYLGTFDTQEDAARAYDQAALQLKGSKAVTNFDKSLYIDGLNQGESSGSHLEQQPDSGEGNLRREPPVQLQNSGDSHQAAAIHIPCDDEPLPLAQEMAGEEPRQLQHILQVPPPLTSPPHEAAFAAPFQPIVGESLLPMAPPRCSEWQTYGADPVISCHSQVLASSPLVSSRIKIQKNQPHHLGSGASSELIIDQDPSPIYGFVLDEPPSNSLLLPNQDFCFRDVGLVPPLVPDPLYLEDESSPLGDDDYPLWEVFKDKGSEENSVDSIFKADM